MSAKAALVFSCIAIGISLVVIFSNLIIIFWRPLLP
jgi:hypothetical protein